MGIARTFGRGVLALCLLAATVTARADSWLPPTTKVYYSQDRRTRLTVTPRGIAGPLAYFDGKVRGDKLAGQRRGDRQTSARGMLEQFHEGHWTVRWNHALVNDVAPTTAVVSNSGRYAVTFDNWYSAGFGPDVVVIYGPDGSVVRSLALTDIVPDFYVQALPRTVSSLWWGGEHRIAEPDDRLILKIVMPSYSGDIFGEHEHVDLSLQLATGQVVPPTDPAWQNALVTARHVAELRAAEEKAADEAFRAPLPAPQTTDESVWHKYLLEACFRLDADGTFPWMVVLPAAGSDDYRKSEADLRRLLLDNRSYQHAMAIASPSSPDNLLTVLAGIVRDVPAGKLKETRIYVAVPAAYRDRAAAILAPTGTIFVHLDPAMPIPQRPERLKQYLEGR